ncbi:MAG: hypothetical protein BM557_05380 [Flavobacterium sp. MedPE-SWcel]|uniref:toxin-antitoxin system YwqK family antitoxin n=1 Tax=uncultured Flavobacterium sp. TaxID=165435 RepID=UPI00092488D9|nr:hypothetical protein [uncultured Flavobacterium sp.]OIQ20105.1 MAG: hypothetical protein BM557_05380 [Flavobacterium sp. MedPE-SWcel]
MKIKFTVVLALLIVNVCAWAQSNQFDAKGQRHGEWKGVYKETKRIRYKGAFEHGKEVGVFKFYGNDEYSSLLATRDFSAKDGSSFTIVFDGKNNKLSEGREVNKLREGEWKFYHAGKTTVMSVEQYSKGKLMGTRKVYFPSGKIAEEAQYKDGLKNGNYKKYTEEGIVLEESVYKDDKLHGLTINRNSEGEVVSKGNFKNDRKTGIWKFFTKGKLTKEEDMTNKKIELIRIRE